MGTEALGQVIKFPVRLRECSECINFMCGPLGAFCSFWREDIIDESCAQECAAFEF